nr:lysine-rich arabinogalactan protein 19-like [Lolium perenne]
MDESSATPLITPYLVPTTAGVGAAVPPPPTANPNVVAAASVCVLFVPPWPNSQPDATPPVSSLVSKARAEASKLPAVAAQMPAKKAPKKVVARRPARPPAPSAPQQPPPAPSTGAAFSARNLLDQFKAVTNQTIWEKNRSALICSRPAKSLVHASSIGRSGDGRGWGPRSDCSGL